MDSETDFYSESNYDELANKIPFVGDMQLFQFEPVFTAAEKDLAGSTSSA